MLYNGSNLKQYGNSNNAFDMDAFMNSEVDFGEEPENNLGFSESVSCEAQGGIATKTATRTYDLADGST